MSESKAKLATSIRLLAEAAPFMAVLAYKGGSLLANQWLEAVYELGVKRISPADVPDSGAQVGTDTMETNL